MDKKVNPPKVGRPRKHKSEKVEYQHIAVHAADYLTFLDKVEESGLKKVELFHQMVENYDGYKVNVKVKPKAD